MHFASRLGLDQQSVRGIPATKDDDFARLLVVENDRLRARVAELETALRQSQSQSHAVSVSPSRKNKTATTPITAKPKAEPWKDAGVSKATYYRRLKAAG